MTYNNYIYFYINILGEINEILQRHRTLVNANADLQHSSTQLEETVDRLTRELQEAQTKQQNDILVATSIIQGLQTELERKRLQGKMQEEENLHRIDAKKGISTEFTQIIQAFAQI